MIWPSKGEIFMRAFLLALCLVFVSAGNSANAGGKPIEMPYHKEGSELTSLTCLTPDGEADCKLYMSGFADTIAYVTGSNPKMSGLCGSSTDLFHEFMQEVRTNPKARGGETHMVLFALLTQRHRCVKQSWYGMSAGSLMDMCRTGDIGFSLCSNYARGVLSALLFMTNETGEHFCGDERLLNNLTLTTLLNERLESDFKLRRKMAAAVMADALDSKMSCDAAPLASDTPPKDVALLIAQAETLNDKCRGGSGDDPATEKACGERDVVFRKIKAKNWCWGHDGQVGSDRTWERCR